MLSSLSNYLFNTGSPLDDVTNLRNNSEYLTQELDDDWLLVNRLGDSEESNPSDLSESDNCDLSSSPSAIQLLPKDTKKPTKVKQRRSRKNPALKLQVLASSSPENQSSPPSSPNQQMDGSWYVTPPPCFTASTGPVALETSPMENLLIEHPSMSVYGPIQGYSLLQGSQSSDTSDDGENIPIDWMTRSPIAHSAFARQLRDQDIGSFETERAIDVDTPIEISSDLRWNISSENQRGVTMAQRVRRRGLSCVTLDCVLSEKQSSYSSHNYQRKLDQRKMKPSYMERQNLVHQYQSNNKRQRNCSHLKQPAKYCGNRC